MVFILLMASLPMADLTRRQAAALLPCLFVLAGCGTPEEGLTPAEPTPTAPCKVDGVVVRLCD